MYRKEIQIVNETGLHARPASDFVALAGKFRSKIEIQKVGKESRCNAKSIIMLLTLGLAKGETAVLTAEGEDEQAAVEALAELMANLKD